MRAIPQEPGLDNTPSLYRDPYGFISKRARAHDSDVFEARILLRKTICMTGPDATRLFYDRERFRRHGAAPIMLQKTLFGQGGLQTLDGEAHQHRRRMMRSILPPERVEALVETFTEEWDERLYLWEDQEQVMLYDQMRGILARAVCRWAGVPLREEVAEARTRALARLYEGAGVVGLKHLRAQRDRDRLEDLLAKRIEAVRAGTRSAPSQTALSIIAHHRDLDGQHLDPQVAAVELLNILRPTVAVAVYLTHLAHALHTHPKATRRLGDPRSDRAFVQEVRRHYPFFPAVAARVRQDFEWQGHRFPKGRRVLLDLHGTNHDPRLWDDPDQFRPERFLEAEPGPYGSVPQGGGDAVRDHRCIGEDTTIALMERALHILRDTIRYDVPEQDLVLDTTRPPALPKSGFVIRDIARVRPVAWARS